MNVPACPLTTTRRRWPNSRSRSASGVSTASSRCRSTATRVAIRSTSSRLCVDSTTARLFGRAASRSAHARRVRSPGPGLRSVHPAGRCRGCAAASGRAPRAVSALSTARAAGSSAAIGDAERRQRSIDGAHPARQPVQPGVGQQVFPDRQPIPESRRLGQETDTRPQPRRIAAFDTMSVQVHFAGRRLDQSGQHPQRRRLAGAIGAEQREDFAAGNLEAGILDRDARAEATGQVDGVTARGLSRQSGGVRTRRTHSIRA